MSSEQRQAQIVDDETTVSFTLRDLLVYFLRLGTPAFGGPIALAGHMQRDLVEERHWVSKQEYLEGLAFPQLSPGPVAAQLAMYVGWLSAGVIGATAVGIALISPSCLMVLALAALYVHFGSLAWIQGMFYGIGAAVIASIARSAIKIVRGTVGKDWLLWTIFAVLARTTAWTQSEIVWPFIQGVTAAAVGAIAGAAYILARRSLIDLPTVITGLITLTVLMFTKKIPEPIVILAAGAVGLLLHGTAR
jgi:chromate transporter